MHEPDLASKPATASEDRGYRMWKKRDVVKVAIGKLARSLKISGEITRKAIGIHENAWKNRVFQWRRVDGIVAACLYAACKMGGVSRSLSEFNERLDGPGERRFYECLKVLSRELNFNPGAPDLISLMGHHSERLGFPPGVVSRGCLLLERTIAKVNVQGKDPNGYVAACLYLACKASGVKTTQERVATALGINASTLRNRLKEIAKLACKEGKKGEFVS
ncbi:MAG: hypothetical protein ACFFCS_18075 [Candidatus Hodarchaeota archaeon]